MHDICSHVETIKRFVSLNADYQECFHKSIWPRLELGNGNNVKDEGSFDNFLKSAIRIEVSVKQEKRSTTGWTQVDDAMSSAQGTV